MKSEDTMNQTLTERPGQADASVQEAARMLGMTAAEIAALRSSLSNDDPGERTTRIRQILAGSGVLHPSALTPQEIANYCEVRTIPVTGRPVSETLVEDRR